MDAIEILSRMAQAAEAAWIAKPEGQDKEVVREVADALRELAQAKLQARQLEGSDPVQSMVVHLIKGSDVD